MADNEIIQGKIIRNRLRDPAFEAPPAASPRWFHRRLPDYAVTPLREVAPLASRLSLGRVFVKDESMRLGLPAFKMLGASWATYRALSDRIGHEPRDWETVDDLRSAFASLQPLTLATATDGNHGRALARMARLLGFASRVWVPKATARARVDAIRSEGAEVVLVNGGYDDAVAASATSANDRTLVISDTSWPGYEIVPRWIIEGYGTILEEVDEQLADVGVALPSVIVVPIGVGALAASVATHYRSAGRAGISLVGVEPVDAACVLESARAGEIITLPGPQASIMAGLNCGTPSRIAWPLVSASFDLFVTVTDREVVTAMQELYRHGIESGECGAASLAAISALTRAGSVPTATAAQDVVLLSTEGVTDPIFYSRHVTDLPTRGYDCT